MESFFPTQQIQKFLAFPFFNLILHVTLFIAFSVLFKIVIAFLLRYHVSLLTRVVFAYVNREAVRKATAILVARFNLIFSTDQRYELVVHEGFRRRINGG